MSLNSLVDYTFAIDLGIGAVTHAKTQFIHQTPLEILTGGWSDQR